MEYALNDEPFDFLGQVNHVNKSNRLILWEYALNGFHRNMKDVKYNVMAGKWLQQARETFPYSSFAQLLTSR